MSASRRNLPCRDRKASNPHSQKPGIHEYGNRRGHQEIEKNAIYGQCVILPHHQRGDCNLHAQTDQKADLPHFFQFQSRPQPGREPADGRYRPEGQLKAALSQQIGIFPQQKNGRQRQSRHGIIGSPRPGPCPQTENHNHSPHSGTGAPRENAVADHQRSPQERTAPKSQPQPPEHQVQAASYDGQVLAAYGQKMGDAVLLIHFFYIRLHSTHIPQKNRLKDHGVLFLADPIQHRSAVRPKPGQK